MFLGNAEQEAEWRGEPFKALLRYWWRVTQPNLPRLEDGGNHELLQKESALFGFAGEMSGISAAKSLVTIMVTSDASQIKAPRPLTNKPLEHIDHPEVSFNEGRIDPLVYMGGMGLIDARTRQVKHSFFPDQSTFELTINYPSDEEDRLLPLIALIQAFGAIGSRCRNGWGSFQVLDGGLHPDKAQELLTGITCDWKKGFDKDYPNCLGRDGARPLVWKTEVDDTWGLTMRDLAQAYAWLRAGNSAERLPGLNPDRDKDPAERHLLGFPLTHHLATNPKWKGWGKEIGRAHV